MATKKRDAAPGLVSLVLIRFLKFFISLPFCLILSPAPLQAQSLDELLMAGQYDEAVVRAAAEPDHYLNELLAQAERLQLAQDPVWHALLHYKPRRFGGHLSQVDGVEFFTSNHGKGDPEQELRTTLAGFFSSHAIAPYGLEPQCRFPARYLWLKQKLDFDGQRLPPQGCRRYEIFMQALQADGLTLVFPAAHPSSPSSMFGHTLLRVDRKGQSEATRMLDYTINYAAEPGDSGGAAYAVKGLTGAFPGKFRVIPYYMKLREYAQMENRDLWEYRLKSRPESMELMLGHVWELLPTYFDYYFFTENCAYHLLSLLEVDGANQGLTDSFTWAVLPVDTIRVLERRGLIEEVNYRASNHRVIEARRQQVSVAENHLATEIARSGVQHHEEALALLESGRQAEMLDLAYDYLRYDKIARNKSLAADLNARERELLLARSRLDVVTRPPQIPPPPVRPDQGHGTSRVNVGFGHDSGGNFIDLGWRAVYHDWLDPIAGYSENFALEFGRIDGRYYTGGSGDGEFKLDRFHLVRLDNYEPRDDFFGLISWNVTTGWEALSADPANGATMYMVRGGPGFTFESSPGESSSENSWLAYGLVVAELGYSHRFADKVNLAAGGEAGVRASFASTLRAELTARQMADLGRDEWQRSSLSLGLSWAAGRDLSLQLQMSRERLLDGWRGAAKIGAYVYF